MSYLFVKTGLKKGLKPISTWDPPIPGVIEAIFDSLHTSVGSQKSAKTKVDPKG